MPLLPFIKGLNLKAILFGIIIVAQDLFWLIFSWEGEK
jgi:hypothetical protein